MISAVISFGLIYLHFASPSRMEEHFENDWHHLSAYTLVAALFFGTANVFLFVAPFIPPPIDAEPYESLPYWTHAVVGWALFGLGALWWIVRFRGQKDLS